MSYRLYQEGMFLMVGRRSFSCTLDMQIIGWWRCEAGNGAVRAVYGWPYWLPAG